MVSFGWIFSNNPYNSLHQQSLFFTKIYQDRKYRRIGDRIKILVQVLFFFWFALKDICTFLVFKKVTSTGLNSLWQRGYRISVQINLHFFHPTWLANFPSYSFIWAHSFMRFAQNSHPTFLFCPTRVFGTWEQRGKS